MDNSLLPSSFFLLSSSYINFLTPLLFKNASIINFFSNEVLSALVVKSYELLIRLAIVSFYPASVSFAKLSFLTNNTSTNNQTYCSKQETSFTYISPTTLSHYQWFPKIAFRTNFLKSINPPRISPLDFLLTLLALSTALGKLPSIPLINTPIPCCPKSTGIYKIILAIIVS